MTDTTATIASLASICPAWIRQPNYLEKKICVRRPYFALNDLFRDSSNRLNAGVPVETPCLNEVGPITAAEAGRHLAILGSCAAADANPANGKHYYLARKAIFRRPLHTCTDEHPEDLMATATGEMSGRRRASASMMLSTAARQTVCTLSVEYHVLNERIFEKLNASKKQPNGTTAGNPYAAPCPLDVTAIDSKSLSASLGKVRPEQCQGHFDNYPAMPIAILMSALTRASARLLSNVTGTPDTPYLVREAIVQADRLGFAGRVVNLSVDFTGMCSGDYTFHGRATTESGKTLGDLRLRLDTAAAVGRAHGRLLGVAKHYRPTPAPTEPATWPRWTALSTPPTSIGGVGVGFRIRSGHRQAS